MRKLETSVVGMQYRIGMSTRGMLAKHLPAEISLRREPFNPADRNAIAVFWEDKPYTGFQIGYLPREVAAILAPLMDLKELEVKKARLVELDVPKGRGEAVIVFKAKAKVPAKKKKKKVA